MNNEPDRSTLKQEFRFTCCSRASILVPCDLIRCSCLKIVGGILQELSPLIDPILMNMSDFSLKLLRWAPSTDLDFVIRSLFYYFECYWKSRRKRMRTFFKLTMYAIAAGWVYQTSNVYHISRSCPHLAKWLIDLTQVFRSFGASEK